jgi:hypothetical protein
MVTGVLIMTAVLAAVTVLGGVILIFGFFYLALPGLRQVWTSLVGETAQATLLSVRRGQAGIQSDGINQPHQVQVVLLKLEVTLPGGKIFPVEHRQVIRQQDVERLQPGAVLKVRIDRNSEKLPPC